MENNPTPYASSAFPQTVSTAIAQLKHRLQRDYEQAYPALGEVIHLVLDEEEANARKLSLFPHLVLPDLVELHIANLNLLPIETKHDEVFAPYHFNEIEADERAFALCG